jgi:opacity protein-like surface antigen
MKMNLPTLGAATLASTMFLAPLAAHAAESAAQSAADSAAESAAESQPHDPAASTTYVSLHLGRNNVDQLRADIDFGAGAPFAGQADAAHGAHAGLALGRRTEHARFELELEYGRFNIKHLTLGPVSADIDAAGHYQAAFANAYRTERLSEQLDAFVGVGIGWGRVSLPKMGLGEDCACFGPASKSGAAMQLRAGLEYRVADRSSIGLQYTALRLPAPEAGGPPAVHYTRKNLGAWSLGFTRRF